MVASFASKPSTKDTPMKIIETQHHTILALGGKPRRLSKALTAGLRRRGMTGERLANLVRDLLRAEIAKV
jgi:hypothetical protein